jgi:hypothetical protein
VLFSYDTETRKKPGHPAYPTRFIVIFGIDTGHYTTFLVVICE